MGSSHHFKPVEFKQTAGYNPENDFVSGGVLSGTTRKASGGVSGDNHEKSKKKKKKKMKQ